MASTLTRSQLNTQSMVDSENVLPMEGLKGGKTGQQQSLRNALGPLRVQDNLPRIASSKEEVKKTEFAGCAKKQSTVSNGLTMNRTEHLQVPSKSNVDKKTVDTGRGFSILCDESFEGGDDDDDDLFNDESLRIDNKPLFSYHSDQEDNAENEPPKNYLNDSTTELFAVVGVQDRSALKELNLDVSMPVASDDDATFITPLDTSLKRSESVVMLDSQEELMGNLDFLYCSHEYRQEILQYLIELEMRHHPDFDYMTRQPDINFKMRSILIDWMLEVTDEYKLEDETLFLAVSFIDRFLSHMTIARQSFQLLGSASLFISSKYQEIYPPDVNEFVSITDDSYTKIQVLHMEMLILKSLKMNISVPTTHYFLKTFMSYVKTSSQVSCLSEYLCYLSMLEGEIFLKYRPSEVAMSSLILSTYAYSEEETLLAEDFLSQTLTVMTSQPRSSIEETETKNRINECIECLSNSYTVAKSHPQQAVYSRYCSPKYYSVASIGIIQSLENQPPLIK